MLLNAAEALDNRPITLAAVVRISTTNEVSPSEICIEGILLRNFKFNKIKILSLDRFVLHYFRQFLEGLLASRRYQVENQEVYVVRYDHIRDEVLQ